MPRVLTEYSSDKEQKFSQWFIICTSLLFGVNLPSDISNVSNVFSPNINFISQHDEYALLNEKELFLKTECGV